MRTSDNTSDTPAIPAILSLMTMDRDAPGDAFIAAFWQDYAHFGFYPAMEALRVWIRDPVVGRRIGLSSGLPRFVTHPVVWEWYKAREAQAKADREAEIARMADLRADQWRSGKVGW